MHTNMYHSMQPRPTCLCKKTWVASGRLQKWFGQRKNMQNRHPKTAMAVLESMDTFFYHQLSLWHNFGFKQELRSSLGPHSRNANWCICKNGNGKTSLELTLLLNPRVIMFIALFIYPQKFMWLYASPCACSLLFCCFKSFLAHMRLPFLSVEPVYSRSCLRITPSTKYMRRSRTNQMQTHILIPNHTRCT